MKSYSAYQKAGIFLCLIVFVGLVVVIKGNLQHIVAERRAQEQRLEEKRKEEQENQRVVDAKRRQDELTAKEEEQRLEREQERLAREEERRRKDEAESSKISEARADTAATANPTEGSAERVDPQETPPPPGFRKINEDQAGVFFNLPQSWTRSASDDPSGISRRIYQSPDGTAVVSLWFEPDPHNTFVQETKRLLPREGYSTNSSETTTIGGEICLRFTSTEDGKRNIIRLFAHNGKGYSLLYRVPLADFTKWEATLDEVRTSFRFKDAPYLD